MSETGDVTCEACSACPPQPQAEPERTGFSAPWLACPQCAAMVEVNAALVQQLAEVRAELAAAKNLPSVPELIHLINTAVFSGDDGLKLVRKMRHTEELLKAASATRDALRVENEKLREVVTSAAETASHALANVRSLTGGDERRLRSLIALCNETLQSTGRPAAVVATQEAAMPPAGERPAPIDPGNAPRGCRPEAAGIEAHPPPGSFTVDEAAAVAGEDKPQAYDPATSVQEPGATLPDSAASSSLALHDYGPGRCEVCGLALAGAPEFGCVPGNCSFRPHRGSAEYARLERRREALGLRAAAARQVDEAGAARRGADPVTYSLVGSEPGEEHGLTPTPASSSHVELPCRCRNECRAPAVGHKCTLGNPCLLCPDCKGSGRTGSVSATYEARNG